MAASAASGLEAASSLVRGMAAIGASEGITAGAGAVPAWPAAWSEEEAVVLEVSSWLLAVRSDVTGAVTASTGVAWGSCGSAGERGSRAVTRDLWKESGLDHVHGSLLQWALHY